MGTFDKLWVFSRALYLFVRAAAKAAIYACNNCRTGSMNIHLQSRPRKNDKLGIDSDLVTRLCIENKLWFHFNGRGMP